MSDYSYDVIEAEDILDAIEIADRMWNEKVYLMRIMEKVGKIEKVDDWNVETYEAVLCRRSYGWHRNTVANSEAKHVAKRYFTRGKPSTRLEFFKIA